MGINLGICTFAALAFENGHGELYPLNCLKEDDYHFRKEIARCDDSESNQATRLNSTLSERRAHYFHALSKHLVESCVEPEVGEIILGDLGGIRDDEETGLAKNWGSRGNLDLHSWAFDRFTEMLDYKAEEQSIELTLVSERGTSKSCSACGRTGAASVSLLSESICSRAHMTYACPPYSPVDASLLESVVVGFHSVLAASTIRGQTAASSLCTRATLHPVRL